IRTSSSAALPAENMAAVSQHPWISGMQATSTIKCKVVRMAHEAIRAADHGRHVGKHHYARVPSDSQRRHAPVTQPLGRQRAKQRAPSERAGKRSLEHDYFGRSRGDEERMEDGHHRI